MKEWWFQLDMCAVRAQAQQKKAHQGSLKMRRLDSPIPIIARDRLRLDSGHENSM
jgi:hypothetical protein